MPEFLRINVEVTQEMVDAQGWERQSKSQIPLSEQVENWDEVVAWGYGAEVDGWMDIFGDKNDAKTK